ncbi:hypothetical protein D3C80_1549160 [compost metagenome]
MNQGLAVVKLLLQVFFNDPYSVDLTNIKPCVHLLVLIRSVPHNGALSLKYNNLLGRKIDSILVEVIEAIGT